MEKLNMSFAVIRDEKEFWVTYEMVRINHYPATFEQPEESVYEFIDESAEAVHLDDENIKCPIDHDELQKLAEEHAKKHEVQVG